MKKQQQDFLESCTATLQRWSDEFKGIASGYAAKLRQMEPAQELIAEQLILKVLAHGLNGDLTTQLDVVQVSYE